MDAVEKFEHFSGYMDFEPAEETELAGQNVRGSGRPVCLEERSEKKCRTEILPIFQAALPGGKRIPLLKTMLTSVCERNCYYCFCRAGRDTPRATFIPDEMANAYMNLWQSGVVEGLFLSSGVAGGGVRTQDRLIDTAEILRRKMGFAGYLHLKLMPGSEREQVERSMQLANRVSINLEAPNTNRLKNLAPMKIFMEELLQPLAWVEEIRRSEGAPGATSGKGPSSTTQFVVGAAGESDRELLETTAELYRRLHLSRVYYSRFTPIAGTPLDDQSPTEPIRILRLYQASFLLRDYHYPLKDILIDQDGRLPKDEDPKLAWAREYLMHNPVEINSASLGELLHIPGFGRKSVDKIIQNRKKGRLHRLDDLKALGITTSRAVPYILIDGRTPNYQPRLW